MSTYVIKLGGAVCLQDETLRVLAAGLRSLRRAGHRPVVVHGGGPQIDAALSQLGEKIVKHKGLRRTSPAAVRVVRRELDAIGSKIAAALARRGVPAQHVPSDERVLAARVKTLPDGFDLGRVGTFAGFETERVLTRSDVFDAEGGDREADGLGPVPVLTPVGFDALGALNINADEAAAAIAAGLGAERLLLATDVPAVQDGEGNAVARLDEAAAADLILDGTAAGGMVPKLMAALAALEAGVGSVLVTRLRTETLVALTADSPGEGTLVTTAREATGVFRPGAPELAEVQS